jgi:hypothetical protein
MLLTACSGAVGDGTGPSEAEIANQAKALEKDANDAVNASIARIKAEAEAENPTVEPERTEDQ